MGTPRKRVPRICLNCGKSFEVWPSYVKRGSGKYCSKKCVASSLKQRITITCKICGKPIETVANKIRLGAAYCSRECFYIGRRNGVRTACSICGKQFIARAGQIKSGGGKYCSIKCSGIANSGENCHAWKGGISFEPYCPKFTREFKERVRAFFGHLCVECGTPQNGERLHVHHVNFDKQSCCNDTIPLFVPLCRSCHMKTGFNREYWEQHFTELINGFYGGRCYLSHDEMTALKPVTKVPGQAVAKGVKAA